MSKSMICLGVSLLVCVGFVACVAKRPVLYPNAHLHAVGHEAAQRDIEECIELAKEHGVTSKPGAKVAGGAAKGAAIGVATGAAVGAVTGNVGRGAAVGAAGGGAAGGTRGLFRSRDPEPVFRRFVEQCLREKGYKPIGWR